MNRERPARTEGAVDNAGRGNRDRRRPAFTTSISTLTQAKRELAQQQSKLRDARARLQKSRDENAIIARYLNDYQYLQRIGFIGDEQRINWLEALRFTNQQAAAVRRQLPDRLATALSVCERARIPAS